VGNFVIGLRFLFRTQLRLRDLRIARQSRRTVRDGRGITE
jgi:hypothetical protein